MKLKMWWLVSVLLVLGSTGCIKVYPPTPAPSPHGPVDPKPVDPAPIPDHLSIFESDFNKVQVGWTAAQVEASIGKPWRTVAPDQKGHTYWHYRVRLEAGAESVDVDGEVEFNGSTVAGKVIF